MTSRPSVFSAKAVAAPIVGAANATEATITTTNDTPDDDPMMRTSLYLPRAVHDKLREIAYVERCKVHDLFIEGIDKVLAERGFASTKELRSSAKAL